MLSSGSTVAHVLTLLLSPLLLRLYPPEAYGVATLFVSIVLVLNPLVCLGYDHAIVMPSERKAVADVFASGIAAAGMTSLVFSLVFWMFRRSIAAVLGTAAIASYGGFLPLALGGWGLFSCLNNWTLQEKRFGSMARAQIWKSVASNGSKIAVAMAGTATAAGWIWGYVLGLFAAVLTLAAGAWRELVGMIRRISLRGMGRMAVRYRNFPLYTTGSLTINSLSAYLPAILLATFFSPTVAGFYMLGQRLVKLPLEFLGMSIAQVLYQRAAAIHRSGEAMSGMVVSVLKVLLVLGLFPFLGLMVLGADLFVVAFGFRWIEAGRFVQILSPWILMAFVTMPLATLFNVLERQRKQLSFNVLLLAVRVAALLIGGACADARLAVILFSAGSTLIIVILLGWILKTSGVPVPRTAVLMLGYLLLAMPFLVALVALKALIPGRLALLGAGLLVLLLYGLVAFGTQAELRRAVLALLRHHEDTR